MAKLVEVGMQVPMPAGSRVFVKYNDAYWAAAKAAGGQFEGVVGAVGSDGFASIRNKGNTGPLLVYGGELGDPVPPLVSIEITPLGAGIRAIPWTRSGHPRDTGGGKWDGSQIGEGAAGDRIVTEAQALRVQDITAQFDQAQLDLSAERAAVGLALADVAQAQQLALGTVGILPQDIYANDVTALPLDRPVGTTAAWWHDGLLQQYRMNQAGVWSPQGAPLVTSDAVELRVSSVAALRARTCPERLRDTPVATRGYYGTFSQGGATYDPDPTDTTSTDNGGTVIVGADGLRYKLRQSGVANVRQFGARGDGVTDDSDAIDAAFNSLPMFSTASSIAQGGIIIRKGTVYFPGGTYGVSRPVRPTAATKWYGEKGQYHTLILALPGFAPDANNERFVVDVAASLMADGRPSGNITHGLEWSQIAVNCNGALAGPGVSGIRWTGCETNALFSPVVGYHRKRGLVINDPYITNMIPGNNTYIDSCWITGDFDNTEGPGLTVKGNGHSLGLMTIQHHNTSGNFKNPDGSVIPAVYLDRCYGTLITRLADESSHTFLHIFNSQQITIGSVEAARPVSLPQLPDSTGVKITGDSYDIEIPHLSAVRMAIALTDTSSSNGLTNNYVVPGVQTGAKYTNYAQVKFAHRLFIGGFVQNNADTLGVSGVLRVRNKSAGTAARIVADATAGQIAQIELAENGVTGWTFANRPDAGDRLRIQSAAGALFDVQSNGTVEVTPASSASPARLQLKALGNLSQIDLFNNGALLWSFANRPDAGNVMRTTSAAGTVMDWDQNGLVKFYSATQYTSVTKATLPNATTGRMHHITDPASGRPGLVVANGGAWVEVPGALTATATLDFPSIPAQGQAELTVTVAGAVTGDSVSLGRPAAPEPGTQATARVSAANTVTVRVSNVTAAAIDPAAASYKVTVHK